MITMTSSRDVIKQAHLLLDPHPPLLLLLDDRVQKVVELEPFPWHHLPEPSRRSRLVHVEKGFEALVCAATVEAMHGNCLWLGKV